MSSFNLNMKNGENKYASELGIKGNKVIKIQKIWDFNNLIISNWPMFIKKKCEEYTYSELLFKRHS